jgi:RNA-directed DNA polymerase
MEEALAVKKYVFRSKGKRRTRYDGPTKVVKYADDFVVLCETKAQADDAKHRLEQWLSERGLQLSAEKTQIVHSTDGFDFLGFTVIRRKNAQSRKGYAHHILPSQKSVDRFKDQVRNITRKYRGHPPDRLLKELNLLIIGWANYYRVAVCSKTFRSLDCFVWTKLWKWARQRHPNKGKGWVRSKYFPTRNGRKWLFYAASNGRSIQLLTSTKSINHRKVIDTHSKDDPELTAYWLMRAKVNNPERGVRQALFNRQQGLCLRCEDWLARGEATHVHHQDGNRNNHRFSNLELVHETCHHQITTSQRRSA